MARLIKADGTSTDVKPVNDKGFTLEELQRLVGGYVQPLDLGQGFGGRVTMMTNEDGQPKGLPVNKEASQLVADRARDAARTGGWESRATQAIVGDVVVVVTKGGRWK